MNVLKVGITGGIGAGKSIITKIFSILGVPVYDADTEAKKLYETDKALLSAIKQEFGASVFAASGALDRAALAGAVFNKPERLAKLNGLVHPRVANHFAQWVSRQRAPYVLKEAALLFESGSAKGLDIVIVITAPEALRLRRVLARDTRTEQQIRDIMARQMPESEKVAQADFLIANDETGMVVPRVLDVHKSLLALTLSEHQSK